MMYSIPAMMMRAGTSRGIYLLKSDLPNVAGPDLDALLLTLMGSPGQLDGLGGGSTTTSKVAIVSPSERPDCDVDYLFAQVSTDRAAVDWAPTCGNLLAGVGPFAIERSLVRAGRPTTTVRVRQVNTGAKAHCIVATESGQVAYDSEILGEHQVSSSVPVDLRLSDFVGGTTGDLLPTGAPLDSVNGIEFTGMDASVCAVIVRARDFGISGTESAAEINSDHELIEEVSRFRSAAAQVMGLGDVRGSVLPKVMLIASEGSGCINSRYFVPGTCHPAHAVSGAVCLATAAVTTGTVLQQLSSSQLVACGSATDLTVLHPSGTLRVRMQADPMPVAHVRRTARKLFDGKAFATGNLLAS